MTNDQIGLICYSFQLYSKKEVTGIETKFRLLLKYPKIVFKVIFPGHNVLLLTKKVLHLLSWKTVWT